MEETPFSRILVATLGSPSSERAVSFAVRMARAYRLELVILAVVAPAYEPKGNAAWGVALSAEPTEDLKRRAREALESAAASAAAEGVRYRCELRQGHAAAEILNAAAEHGCDAIVIGSRGRSDVERLSLGETANEVVLTAPVPVIVVK